MSKNISVLVGALLLTLALASTPVDAIGDGGDGFGGDAHCLLVIAIASSNFCNGGDGNGGNGQTNGP